MPYQDGQLPKPLEESQSKGGGFQEDQVKDKLVEETAREAIANKGAREDHRVLPLTPTTTGGSNLLGPVTPETKGEFLLSTARRRKQVMLLPVLFL